MVSSAMLLRSPVACWILLHWCAPLSSDAFQNPPVAFRTSVPAWHVARTNRINDCLALQAKPAKVSAEAWYPFVVTDDQDGSDATAEIEEQAVQLCARLIARKVAGNTTVAQSDVLATRRPMIQNRFMDLACSEKGEAVLESLFHDEEVDTVQQNEDVVPAAVMVLQSLCVFGTQVGVKGTPEQLRRMVSHLDARRDPCDLDTWDADSVRRLKHGVDRTAGVQLLAALQRKRTTQGAFDLLVALGAWTPHEDLALLRSGFPLRFSEAEMQAAKSAANTLRDPDEILGLRQDLRHLKVYTIDSAATSEIDDGLSVERIEQADGSVRHLLWIHIADADLWAPRTSELFRTAQRRITSLYLPRSSISMFPPGLGSQVMSLKANQDSCALSLSVELNDDGSVDPSSISVTPSRIHVTYRLTYDDVDEMLEEGTGFREEWELGALLDAATKRRDYRVRNGSSESLIPNPIPYSTVTTFPDKSESDGIGIALKLEVSHNAGKNHTAETGLNDAAATAAETVPVSSSFLLVTEAMILAGESMGRWKMRLDSEEFADENAMWANQLRLPFRTQPPPDFKSRARERRIMEDLRDYNVGGGFCYAWYARRFLLPVKVSEHAFPHSGLGLECYVQWSSPIRRFSDLQTHTSVKRSLRRKRLATIVEKGDSAPPGLDPTDFGWPLEKWPADLSVIENLCEDDLDEDINFLQGFGLIGASRRLQRRSQQYWLFEYVDRVRKRHENMTYTAVVLSCVDPERQQYAVYVYELGLEHRYSSPCQLDPGVQLRLQVDSVHPHLGLLTFVRDM